MAGNRQLVVFVDTAALLPAFASHLNGSAAPLPAFLADAGVTRVTFEKCVFEAYMALRGVGGKKPDEGRNDWAQRHLREGHKDVTLDSLVSRLHAVRSG